MSVSTTKSCKQCRREGEKLFLKGNRCLTAKCSFSKRSFPPGPNTKRMRKISEYGLRLREKQKARRIYGLSEGQFKNYFAAANKKKGVTGANLLIMLESRLDNVVYRIGFSESRNQAREMVSHGHFLVNGKRSNVPSHRIRVGDKITVAEKTLELLKKSADKMKDRQPPAWLVFDGTAWSAQVVTSLTREMIDTPIDDRLIVEHYSR